MITTVIGTTPNREHWLAECLKSIGERPVVVLSDYTFELGKIKWMYENTTIDKFLFLQDSVVIKKPEFFEIIDEYDSSLSINKDPSFYGCYMGIYERRILDQIEIPKIYKKSESIYNEIYWTFEYVKRLNTIKVLFPELSDANATRKEVKFERENLVLENDYLIKYKGDWGQRHVD